VQVQILTIGSTQYFNEKKPALLLDLHLDLYGLHSPQLAAKASYRLHETCPGEDREPVSRKADWIPPYQVRGRLCQARTDGVRGEEDTPLLAAGYFI